MKIQIEETPPNTPIPSRVIDGDVMENELDTEESWRRLDAASEAVKRSAEILDALEVRRERRVYEHREVQQH